MCKKKFFLFFLTLSLSFVSAVAQKTMMVGALDMTRSYTLYGALLTGRSAIDEPVIVQKQLYTHIIGVYAKSKIRINLHKTARSFRTQVALADSNKFIFPQKRLF